MDHPTLGRLKPTTNGGWGLWLALPAFQPCYERWTSEGGERADTRDEPEQAGRFWASLVAVPAGQPGQGVGPSPPSTAQVAAVEHLLANQDDVARAMGEALAREAPEVFHWDYLEDQLSGDMKRKLATPEGIMEVVELQSLVIGVEGNSESALVGFSFHSELLEPEHGVSVIMDRDRVVLVGTWDDLMTMDYAEEIGDEGENV